MADESSNQSSLGSKIFRDSALGKMTSVDDLDRYLKVTNPSAWVLLGAVTVLLAAAIIWGFTAAIPIQVSATGILKGNQVICFLPIDGTTQATVETPVTTAGYDTQIVEIDYNPYSPREVAEYTNNDYVASQSDGNWSYMLTIAAASGISDWNEGEDVPVQFTIKEVAPFAYLFGGAQS